MTDSRMLHLGKNIIGGDHYSIPGCVSLGYPFIDHKISLKPLDSLTDEVGSTLYVFLCPCCKRTSFIHMLPSMMECCCKEKEIRYASAV